MDIIISYPTSGSKISVVMSDFSSVTAMLFNLKWKMLHHRRNIFEVNNAI